MDELIFIAIFCGAIVLVVILLYLVSSLLERRRQAELVSRAALLGFKAVQPEEFRPREMFPELLLLKQAHPTNDLLLKREASGRQPSQYIFDMELHGGQGQSESMTVFLLHAADLDLPPFLLKGRDKTRFTARLIHDVTRATQSWLHHYKAVSVDAPQQFTRQYELLSTETNPGLRSYFTQSLTNSLASKPGWQVEGVGQWLLLYQRGILVRPSGLTDFVTECQAIAHLFSHQN
ncbi:MAG: hypothetical protein ABW072_13200 [Sedimenticola sp.]